MTTERVTVWPLVANTVSGQSTIAAYGPMRGGYIYNPLDASDQGIAIAEDLSVSLLGPGIAVTPIIPGGTFPFPKGFDGAVYVSAATQGHRFAGAAYQPATDAQPSTAAFPPSGLTSLLSVLPQYLYEEYADDENLLGFVQAFNTIVQNYVDYFNGLNLPVYSGLQGKLLDWVALGLYGMARPLLPIGVGKTLGPYNTATYNSIAYNVFDVIGPASFYATTDDVFKRVLTWYLWKGDGKQFNIRWIKRRVERFLTGVDGGGGQSAAGDPSTPQMYPPDNTYDVGVTFGVNGEININLQTLRRFATGGAMFNVAPYNGFAFNEFESETVALPSNPLVPIFKSAVDAGVLAFPFQLRPIVNVN